MWSSNFYHYKVCGFFYVEQCRLCGRFTIALKFFAVNSDEEFISFFLSKDQWIVWILWIIRNKRVK